MGEVKQMKLWRISQTENGGYDTFDAAIVAAETEDEARKIVPDGGEWGEFWSSWCSSPDKVKVDLIGEAEQGIECGVVLASFNAG